MTHISRIKPNTISLLTVILSTSLLIVGCGSAPKKTDDQRLSKPVVAKKAAPIGQLNEPSFAYLLEPKKVDYARQISSKDWLTIAKNNYQAKNYARALRAATEALSRNNQLVEARQLAMLSAVKVTENNVDSYHNNALMNDIDRERFKRSLTNTTTLLNALKD